MRSTTTATALRAVIFSPVVHGQKSNHYCCRRTPDKAYEDAQAASRPLRAKNFKSAPSPAHQGCVIALGGCSPHVLGAGTFGALTDFEFNRVTLAEIAQPLAIDRALMKEVLLAGSVLDKAEALIGS
jgi:hypothetical protein